MFNKRLHSGLSELPFATKGIVNLTVQAGIRNSSIQQKQKLLFLLKIL
jgi:hypothetical protein